MNFKNLLRKMARKNKAFADMQADQKKRTTAVVDTSDVDDAESIDRMSDPELELHLIYRELKFYSDTMQAHGKQVKREWKKAISLAQGRDEVAFRDQRYHLEELCRKKYQIQELERKLKNLIRFYEELARADEYQIALLMLENLVQFITYCDRATAQMEKIWDTYHPEKSKEPERVRERDYALEKEPEEEEWELEL